MRTENQEIPYISCLDSALQKGLKRHALEVFDVKKRQSTFLHTSSWPLGEKKNKKKKHIHKSFWEILHGKELCRTLVLYRDFQEPVTGKTYLGEAKKQI